MGGFRGSVGLNSGAGRTSLGVAPFHILELWPDTHEHPCLAGGRHIEGSTTHCANIDRINSSAGLQADLGGDHTVQMSPKP